jgi:hypothetical protein
MFLIYGIGKSITLIVAIQPDNIELEYESGEVIEFEDYNKPVDLYAVAYPITSDTQIVWSVASDSVDAEIKDGKLYVYSGEGQATLTASSEDKSVSSTVTVFIIMSGSNGRYLYVNLQNFSEQTEYIGEYDIVGDVKQKINQLALNVKVIPSAAEQSVVFESGNCVFDSTSNIITVNRNGDYNAVFALEEDSIGIARDVRTASLSRVDPSFVYLPLLPTGHDSLLVRAELPPGAAVVLYTDGVIEARRGADLFGSERLDALLADHAGQPAQEIADAVVSACRAYAGGDLGDDCAIVVIKKT